MPISSRCVRCLGRTAASCHPAATTPSRRCRCTVPSPGRLYPRVACSAATRGAPAAMIRCRPHPSPQLRRARPYPDGQQPPDPGRSPLHRDPGRLRAGAAEAEPAGAAPAGSPHHADHAARCGAGAADRHRVGRHPAGGNPVAALRREGQRPAHPDRRAATEGQRQPDRRTARRRGAARLPRDHPGELAAGPGAGAALVAAAQPGAGRLECGTRQQR